MQNARKLAARRNRKSIGPISPRCSACPHSTIVHVIHPPDTLVSKTRETDDGRLFVRYVSRVIFEGSDHPSAAPTYLHVACSLLSGNISVCGIAVGADRCVACSTRQRTKCQQQQHLTAPRGVVLLFAPHPSARRGHFFYSEIKYCLYCLYSTVPGSGNNKPNNQSPT